MHDSLLSRWLCLHSVIIKHFIILDNLIGFKWLEVMTSAPSLLLTEITAQPRKITFAQAWDQLCLVLLSSLAGLIAQLCILTVYFLPLKQETTMR